MNMDAGPPPSTMNSSAAAAPHHHRMMMHMTFFWGKNTEILFHGWPGYDRIGMYIFSLLVVFAVAVAVEWLSYCDVLREASGKSAGIMRTVLYTVRIGLAYLVMLAVMSFNAGVFLVAVAGHGLGFFLFGSKRTAEDSRKITSDLPPLNCGC